MINLFNRKWLFGIGILLLSFNTAVAEPIPLHFEKTEVGQKTIVTKEFHFIGQGLFNKGAQFSEMVTLELEIIEVKDNGILIGISRFISNNDSTTKKTVYESFPMFVEYNDIIEKSHSDSNPFSGKAVSVSIEESPQEFIDKMKKGEKPTITEIKAIDDSHS